MEHRCRLVKVTDVSDEPAASIGIHLPGIMEARTSSEAAVYSDHDATCLIPGDGNHKRAFVKMLGISICYLKYLLFNPVAVNVAVLRDVTPCVLVDRCQRTWCHIPEDRHYHVYRRKTNSHPLLLRCGCSISRPLHLVPIEQETRRTSESVWTFWRTKKVSLSVLCPCPNVVTVLKKGIFNLFLTNSSTFFRSHLLHRRQISYFQWQFIHIIACVYVHIALYGRVLSAPASYVWGPGFKFEHWNRLFGYTFCRYL
jgi:hypothetical protein